MLVRWTTPAANDLTNMCDYTEERFGAAQARHAAVAIYEAADLLKDMPHRGRSGRKLGTRELIVSKFPFIVVYRVGTEAVEIVRIVHGSQQWP
jgi:toxin ParE1/3/4